MKKYLLIAGFLLSFAGFSFAQTAPAKKDKAAKPATTAQPATAASPATTTKPTPAPAAGPLKKDGTPDKRYKANKQPEPTQHLKKDGTPDKRYKENKKQ